LTDSLRLERGRKWLLDWVCWGYHDLIATPLAGKRKPVRSEVAGSSGPAKRTEAARASVSQAERRQSEVGRIEGSEGKEDFF